MRRRSSVDDVKKAVDNYEATIQALLAVATDATWDGAARAVIPEAKFFLGRRMTSSAANRVSPNTEVTPDLVVQRNAGYGLVVEAKGDLPNNKDHWRGEVSQLEKYDDDLTGWFSQTGRVAQSDAVYLIHQSRAVDLVDYLKELKARGELTLNHAAIVSFIRTTQVKTFITLRKEDGDIRDAQLNDRWRRTNQVPLEKLIAKFGQVKFYDTAPPLAYTLEIIWTQVLAARIEDTSFDAKEKCYPMLVTPQDIRTELAKYFRIPRNDDRDPEIPKTEWVADAFGMLVELGLAEKVRDSDAYRVRYKNKRGDILESFARAIKKVEQRRKKKRGEESKDQLALPVVAAAATPK